jgi:hypothetical protein
MPSEKFSMNKFLVKPYEVDRSLRSNSSSGFAMIEQRAYLKGLTTIMEAHITVGREFVVVPTGSTVFVKEEEFFKPGGIHKIYKSEGDDVEVQIVDVASVEFIDPFSTDEITF